MEYNTLIVDSIINELVKAKRYDSVMKMLYNMLPLKSGAIRTVGTVTNSDNTFVESIVSNDAYKLIGILKGITTLTDDDANYDWSNLYNYVNMYSEIEMHNFANDYARTTDKLSDDFRKSLYVMRNWITLLDVVRYFHYKIYDNNKWEFDSSTDQFIPFKLDEGLMQ